MRRVLGVWSGAKAHNVREALRANKGFFLGDFYGFSQKNYMEVESRRLRPHVRARPSPLCAGEDRCATWATRPMAGPRQDSPGKERRTTLARHFALEVYRRSVTEKLAAAGLGMGGQGGKGVVKLPAILRHTEGTTTGKNLHAYVEKRKKHADQHVDVPHPSCQLTSSLRHSEITKMGTTLQPCPVSKYPNLDLVAFPGRPRYP